MKGRGDCRRLLPFDSFFGNGTDKRPEIQDRPVAVLRDLIRVALSCLSCRQRLQLHGRLPLEAHRLTGSQDRRNAIEDAAQARGEGAVESLGHHVFQYVEAAFLSHEAGAFAPRRARYRRNFPAAGLPPRARAPSPPSPSRAACRAGCGPPAGSRSHRLRGTPRPRPSRRARSPSRPWQDRSLGRKARFRPWRSRCGRGGAGRG